MKRLFKKRKPKFTIQRVDGYAFIIKKKTSFFNPSRHNYLSGNYFKYWGLRSDAIEFPHIAEALASLESYLGIHRRFDIYNTDLDSFEVEDTREII